MNVVTNQLFITDHERPSQAIAFLVKERMGMNDKPLFLFEVGQSVRTKMGKLRKVRAKGNDEVIIQLSNRTKSFSATLCCWYDAINDARDKIKIVDVKHDKTYIIAEK